MPKEISRLLLIAILLGVFLPCMADALTIKTTRKLVVLDPGHGGSDPGITSTTGILEKRIVLNLARMTADLLSNRYQTLLSRTTDVSLSANDRAAFANQNKADLFLSLHLHAEKNKSFFFFFGTPDSSRVKNDTQWRTQGLLNQHKSRQAAALFAKIFQSLDNETGTHFGPAPAIPLEGLKMPAILTEPFTIADIPGDPADQQDFLAPYAKKLTRCIEAYFENNF